MRLTMLDPYAKGAAHGDPVLDDQLQAGIERIKWLLWHGNQHRALQTMDCCEGAVGALEVDHPNLSKFARTTHEFAVSITNNTGSLINDGERLRAGERISPCLAESTLNAVVSTVISRHFANQQQMPWTRHGAHLPLRTRTRARDGSLRPPFERWSPGLANDPTKQFAQVAA